MLGLPILYKSVYCRANCIQSLLGIRTVPACFLGPRDMCNLTQAACAIPAEGQRGINTRCGTVGNGPNDQFHMLRACGSQHAQISPHCLVADIMRTICGNSWNPPQSPLQAPWRQLPQNRSKRNNTSENLSKPLKTSENLSFGNGRPWILRDARCHL